MFVIKSSAFEDGGEIGNRYCYKMNEQCHGENYSPPLSWSGAPVGTMSFLLTVTDPDGGNWLHWLLMNIPADQTNLEERLNGPEVGIIGRNSFGRCTYGGPCPPTGTHRYIFSLYALDTILGVDANVTLKEVQSLIRNHVLAHCELMGTRSAR